MLARLAGAWLAAALLLLSGCATVRQEPVNLSADYFKAKPGRIGVAMSTLPKVDTEFPGAGCLLCLAAASLNNSSLTGHVRTLAADDLNKLKPDVAELLRARGMDVVMIDSPLQISDFPDAAKREANRAAKDFSALKAKYGIDRLLVLHISAVGVWRNYSAYFPTGAPQAVVKGSGYIVDLGTQSLEWFQPIDVNQASEGSWDEPPKFPGMTNAFYQALERSMDSVKQPFKP